MKRKIILPFNTWILRPLGLVIFSLFLMSCSGYQTVGPDTSVPDLILTTPKMVATSTAEQAKIPTSRSVPVQLSPTVVIFNSTGSLLFSDTHAIIMADIKSKSQVVLTKADSIYSQLAATENGYIYYLSDQGASRGILEVYRIKPGDKKPERITYDNYYDFDLTSCYSQEIVAYVSDQHETNGTYNIYISGFHNSIRPQKILSKTQRISGLSCSPDGKYVAFFISGSNGVLGDLYIVNIDGTNLSKLTQNNNISTYALSWSPDSQHIVVVTKIEKGDNLAIVNVFDKMIAEFKNTEVGLNIKAPLWAPDGSKILFEAFNAQETKLKVMDSDGSNEKILLDSAQDGGFFSYSAAWSPNSKFIACEIENADKMVNLYILELDSGIQEKLLTEDYISINSLSWVLPSP